VFIAYEVSLDLIRSLREIIPTIKKYDRDLADQMHRAATSVALNLAEGSEHSGQPTHSFRIRSRQRERGKGRARGCGIVGMDRRCDETARSSGSAARIAMATHAPSVSGKR
jgi:23S rRNA-intervening sequence protein